MQVRVSCNSVTDRLPKILGHLLLFRYFYAVFGNLNLVTIAPTNHPQGNLVTAKVLMRAESALCCAADRAGSILRTA